MLAAVGIGTISPDDEGGGLEEDDEGCWSKESTNIGNTLLAVVLTEFLLFDIVLPTPLFFFVEITFFFLTLGGITVVSVWVVGGESPTFADLAELTREGAVWFSAFTIIQICSKACSLSDSISFDLRNEVVKKRSDKIGLPYPLERETWEGKQVFSWCKNNFSFVLKRLPHAIHLVKRYRSNISLASLWLWNSSSRERKSTTKLSVVLCFTNVWSIPHMEQQTKASCRELFNGSKTCIRMHSLQGTAKKHLSSDECSR